MIRIICFLYCCFLTQVVFASTNILVIGDSISAGYGLQQNQSWVSLLQQRIDKKEYPYIVINASISGDTSDNGLLRIKTSLELHKPSIVVIELGGNDGLRGLSLKNMKKNLAEIIHLCQQKKSKVLLVGMNLPPNYGPAYTQRFSEIYVELAKEFNIPLVPFLLKGIESNLKYFQKDQIHPTAEAQKFLLNNVWEGLHPLLK